MLRVVLEFILVLFVARAFWRVIDGVMQGLAGPSPSQTPPDRTAHMVRDPVCGTFILPERALTLNDARPSSVYFCSAACRDTYRTRRRPLAEAPRPEARGQRSRA